MNNKRIEDLSDQEFRGMLDYMASEEFGRMTVAEFFDVLAAMEEEELCERLELKAAVKDGQLTFIEPAPLYVHGNEIRLGNKLVVIKLVPENVSEAI